jgi:hypothetical protein
VEANHTKIILSRSSTSPDPVTTLIIPRNGSPVDLYVWAVNVHNSSGASAFDVRFEFDPALGDISFLEYYGPPQYPGTQSWIGSTNRSPVCIGAIGPNGGNLADGQAYASCSSFSPPPPYGALGTGKIAHIRFTPPAQLMTGTLDMRDSFLVDTPLNPADQQQIPAAAPLIYVLVTKCADFNFDGTIDLFNDIFGVAFRFGMTTADPGWDPKYDLDDSGNIDLFNDIFNTAFQFGGSC